MQHTAWGDPGRGSRWLAGQKTPQLGTQSSLGFLLHQMYNAVTIMPACFLCNVVLVAQTVQNLPAMQETGVPSLGQEDPLEKGMAIHSIILAWRIPRTEDPGGLQSRGLSDMTDQLTHTHKEVAVAVRCSPEAEITGCRALSLCSSEQKSNDQSTVGTMQGPPWGTQGRRAQAGGLSWKITQSVCEVKVLVAQLCLILCNPIGCSPPGFSVHRVLQAGILERVAMSISRELFLTQGLNLGLPHGKQFLYRLSHQGSQSVWMPYFQCSMLSMREEKITFLKDFPTLPCSCLFFLVCDLMVKRLT